jgi:ABC-2 type transport system ATP-binding protein
MKQRVCVASALLSDPTVVLLDEPTNGLDPRGMSEVRGIIKSLKGKSRLIFMSSHLLSEVSEVCDEVAMIDHGKLVVYDTIANVTARFSGGENVVEVGFKQPVDATLISRVSKIQGVTAALKGDDTSLRISFTGGLAVQESILASMVRMNLGVISYKSAASALEDAYLGLIKDTV